MTQKQPFSRSIKKQTLAEQVAETIRESILTDQWQSGDALPTEPELSEQFGVSRAVIRDATRMLAAQGLVEAQHGRGVFVTESQSKAFGEALLLALRRTGATVWDVEYFEQLFYPEIFAEAARNASDDEIFAMREATDSYLQRTRTILEEHWDDHHLPVDEQQALMVNFRELMAKVFAATHNQVIEIVYTAVLQLRNVRSWQDEEATLEDVMGNEEAYMRMAVDAIASRDPDKARETIRRLMQLPREAEVIMKETPIGDVPIIPVSPHAKQE
jgi:GntR family transcriptional repressor for pyruvate dehydrogenase complex